MRYCRSWRSRLGLMVSPWCRLHLYAHQNYWPGPLNKSPSSVTAHQRSIAVVHHQTCPPQQHWTSTMALSPLTRFLWTVGTVGCMETPGRVKWRNWWGTTACLHSRQMTCCRLCLRRVPTPWAATTAPAPTWRRRSLAVNAAAVTQFTRITDNCMVIH